MNAVYFLVAFVGVGLLAYLLLALLKPEWFS